MTRSYVSSRVLPLRTDDEEANIAQRFEFAYFIT